MLTVYSLVTVCTNSCTGGSKKNDQFKKKITFNICRFKQNKSQFCQIFSHITDVKFGDFECWLGSIRFGPDTDRAFSHRPKVSAFSLNSGCLQPARVCSHIPNLHNFSCTGVLKNIASTLSTRERVPWLLRSYIRVLLNPSC